MRLGEIIQHARKERGLTVTALAHVAGIHKSTLSRWESGRTVPFTHELTLVMDALGFSDAQRRACYQSIVAPRAIQVAMAAPGDTLTAVSQGEILRALRLRAGLTQADAARAIGVSQGLIAKWEKSECLPGSKYLHSLCFAYRVTLSEMAFLTTHTWQHFDALPTDKESLDAIIWHLETQDTNRERAGIYLALAARYQELHRAGKINEIEANEVYGYYGSHQSWRLSKFHGGWQISAPTLGTLPKSHGPLTQGQRDAVTTSLEYYCHHRQPAKAISLLQAIKPRTKQHPSWWLDYRAFAAEKSGEMDSAMRYSRDSITHATSERDAGIRRLRSVALHCRTGRFREAIPHLAPLPTLEKRPNVIAANHLNYAWVCAGLGQRGEAITHYDRADEIARRHDFDDVNEMAATVANLL